MKLKEIKLQMNKRTLQSKKRMKKQDWNKKNERNRTSKKKRKG